MRQQPLLHADHENDRELEALDHVQRDQRDALAVLVVGVDIRDQRNLGQEILQALSRIAVVEAFGEPAKLVQVLHARLALWRAVKVVPAQVHDLDHLVDQLARPEHSHGRADRLDLGPESLQGGDRDLGHARHAAGIDKDRHDVRFAVPRE